MNGGLYVIPWPDGADAAPALAQARGVLSQQQDASATIWHMSDQLGMGLALAESGLRRSTHCRRARGLPTHLPTEWLSKIPAQEVSGIHYHGHVDQHGLPRPAGVDWIDDAIGRMNGVLADRRRKRFSNEIFWDFRYAQFPELGSGVGSRNEPLAHKQRLLRPISR